MKVMIHRRWMVFCRPLMVNCFGGSPELTLEEIDKPQSWSQNVSAKARAVLLCDSLVRRVLVTFRDGIWYNLVFDAARIPMSIGWVLPSIVVARVKRESRWKDLEDDQRLHKIASISNRDGLVFPVDITACFQMLVLISNTSLMYLGIVNIEYLVMLQAFWLIIQ